MGKLEIPWQTAFKPRIYPVFLPFMGCKKRCVFCSQNLQTGVASAVLSDLLNQYLPSLKKSKNIYDEMAFYGGTFTGLPDNEFKKCLSFASLAKKEGCVKGFRCSTRPDFLPDDRIEALQDSGFHTVELGIQTFAEHALKQCGRDYGLKACENAFFRLKKAGIKIGVQLMPGFPFTGDDQFCNDVKLAIDLGADFFRFYPCLVFRGTDLANMWIKGEYRAPGLQEALEQVARAWLLCRKKNLPVIRMGIAEQDRLSEDILAGPVHNSFGNMVMGHALLMLVREEIKKHGKLQALVLPKNAQGYLWGWQGKLAAEWESLGIGRKNIKFHGEEKIQIFF